MKIDNNRENNIIDDLMEIVKEISSDFEKDVDLDSISKKVYIILKYVDKLINSKAENKIISKGLKLASFAIYNYYSYRTKDVELLSSDTIEIMYKIDDADEEIRYIGFIEAIDKTSEIELMEVLEKALSTDKIISKDLWMRIYDVMITEYNISIGEEEPGDEWVKAWNNYSSFKNERGQD